MAFAGARFVDSLLQATVLKKTGITEYTYVKSPAAEGVEYFSTNVELGPDGVKKIHGLPEMNAHEKTLYAAAAPELIGSIKKGIEFVHKA